VGIDVGQTHHACRYASHADKASEDDAAVAAEQQDEAPVFGRCCDPFTER